MSFVKINAAYMRCFFLFRLLFLLPFSKGPKIDYNAPKRHHWQKSRALKSKHTKTSKPNQSKQSSLSCLALCQKFIQNHRVQHYVTQGHKTETLTTRVVMALCVQKNLKPSPNSKLYICLNKTMVPGVFFLTHRLVFSFHRFTGRLCVVFAANFLTFMKVEKQKYRSPTEHIPTSTWTQSIFSNEKQFLGCPGVLKVLGIYLKPPQTLKP